MKSLKKIWNDPVWSKVIAGAILAIATQLWLLKGYLYSQRVGSGAISFFKLIWFGTIEINNVVLIALIVFVALTIFSLIRNLAKGKSAKEDIETQEVTATKTKPTYSEEDKIAFLSDWAEKKSDNDDLGLITYSQTDEELGLNTGDTKRLIERVVAAKLSGYIVDSKGENVIRFRYVSNSGPFIPQSGWSF